MEKSTEQGLRDLMEAWTNLANSLEELLQLIIEQEQDEQRGNKSR